jgi:phospholipid/cholesterol/gamma-HCH transport system substrate-binding protein
MLSATASQKTKLGLFLVVTGALLGLVLLLFAGLSLRDQADRYYLQTDESVSGLRAGAPVEVRGVDVGQVAGVELARGRRPVTVALDIALGTPVPIGASAVLRTKGVTGLMYVDIDGGDFLGKLREPGEVIPASPSALSKITDNGAALVEESRKLVGRGNEVATRLSDVLDDENRARVDRMLERGERVMASLEQASAHMAKTSARLDQLLTQQGAQMLEAAGALIGDARRMVQGSRHQIGAAVVDLREAARAFRHMAEKLEQDPSRLLFRREERGRR